MKVIVAMKNNNMSMPDGPWANEPDFVLLRMNVTGSYACIVRNEAAGHLCGYVQIPESHPWHGVDYNDDRFLLDNTAGCVHGGLTYSGSFPLEGDSIGEEIPSRAANGWWLGFDCNHGCDYAPLMPLAQAEENYKSTDYVLEEIKALFKKMLSTPID